MKALKIIAAALVGLVALALIGGSVLPNDYRVERSIDIAAPPAAVFAEVNSLRRWDAWSPWLARDESIDNRHSGPEAGVGAKVSWTSADSGNGSQEILESVPGERIVTQLDFGEQGRAHADWSFVASEGGTRVTWGMQGDIPGPLGGLIAGQMEGFIGADYEDGLARLKRHLEGLPPPPGEPPATERQMDAGVDAGADAGPIPLPGTVRP